MRISDWSSDVCSSDLRVKAQLLRHGEGFARCHHCRTEQHVVADLRCLSIAGVACVDDCFAHGGQDRFGAFECVVSAADHEGQRAASRSGNTTGNWRIDHFKALFHGGGYHLTRSGHVDGRAIEKQGSRRCCTENLIAVDHVHMLTSRKHCHHGISTCNSGSSRGGAAASGVHSRSEEHTSELQSLMRLSYAAYCL